MCWTLCLVEAASLPFSAVDAVVSQGTQFVGENGTGTMIVGAAMKVHTVLGPGLLESAYAHCMAHELANRGAIVRTEVVIPIIYEGLQVEKGYRADLIVNEHVVVELKVVEKILPVHRIQLLGYLRLGDFRLGYL